jgi:type IV pilus assembly protein PilW
VSADKEGVYSTDDPGFTLIEVLLAVSVAVVMLGAASSFILTSLRQSNAASSRTVAARQAEVLLSRLTREVREAQYIEDTATGNDTTPVNVTYGGGSSSISFYMPKTGSSSAGTKVTWSCTAEGSCTRSTEAGGTVTMLTGVKSATFTPLSASGTELASGAGVASSPSYPTSIRLMLSVKDISQQDRTQSHTVEAVKNAITVQDGVDLRNYS